METEHDQPCVIVSGNPVAGFTFIGPFANADAANEYAREFRADAPDEDGLVAAVWMVAPLKKP